MSYILRPYQKDAVRSAIRYFEENNSKGIIVAPTGAGKSLIIAEIAHRLTTPVLVLQPSKELLEQNYQKYLSYGNKASIYSASLNSREIHNEVTFGTIGTVKSNVEGFIMAGIKHVIIDECHLSSKNSSATKKFLDDIGVKKVIGLTATPLELKSSLDRGSYLQFITRSRKNMFKDVVDICQIKDIVDKGFWSDIIYETNSTDQNRLKLNSSGNDFTDSSILDHYNYNMLESKILRRVEELISEGRKSILVFMPSIEKSDYMGRLLRDSGITCRSVHSKMDNKSRKEAIDGFKNLSITVVTNVNVLSVGFDHPELDAIIMARPTNSFAVFYQQAGRGVRIHPNKKNVKICDFSGNIERFGELETIRFSTEHNGKWEMFNATHKLTGEVEPISNGNDKNHHLWFGLHRGKHIKDVPNKYLEWMLRDFRFNKDQMILKINIENHLRDSRVGINKTF